MFGGGVMPVLSGALADHLGIGATFAIPSIAHVFKGFRAIMCYLLE
jgi:fucose permease